MSTHGCSVGETTVFPLFLLVDVVVVVVVVIAE